jgi:hypothetical protein
VFDPYTTIECVLIVPSVYRVVLAEFDSLYDGILPLLKFKKLSVSVLVLRSNVLIDALLKPTIGIVERYPIVPRPAIVDIKLLESESQYVSVEPSVIIVEPFSGFI